MHHPNALPGSPATGLCRWGGYRGPRRQVFVAGVVTGVPGDRSLSLGWSGAWVGNHVSQFTTIFCRPVQWKCDQTLPTRGPDRGLYFLRLSQKPRRFRGDDGPARPRRRAPDLSSRRGRNPHRQHVQLHRYSQAGVGRYHPRNGSSQNLRLGEKAHRRRLSGGALPRRNSQKHSGSGRRNRHRRTRIYPRSRGPNTFASRAVTLQHSHQQRRCRSAPRQRITFRHAQSD